MSVVLWDPILYLVGRMPHLTCKSMMFSKIARSLKGTNWKKTKTFNHHLLEYNLYCLLRIKKTRDVDCRLLRFTGKPGPGGELQSDTGAGLLLSGQWLRSKPTEEEQEGEPEVQPDVAFWHGEGEDWGSQQISVFQLGKTRPGMLSVWSSFQLRTR